jgi:hypothetical protein
MYPIPFVLAFVINILAVSGAVAFQVENEELEFTVEIPDGFNQYDNLKTHSDARTRRFVEKNTLYAFNRGGSPETNNYTGIFLFVERSSLTMLAGFDTDSENMRTETIDGLWRGHDITLHRMERNYTTNGDRLVTINAVIPLDPEPIQVKLSGDIKDEEQMRGILREVVSSIDGKASIYAHMAWLKFGAIVLVAGVAGLVVKRKMLQ